MQTIDNFNFKEIKALIRVDFNVPLDNAFHITDTSRIDATLPTIQKILNDGGSVILMSHLGRPKGGPEEKFSLKHLVPYLSEKMKCTVLFADDCIGESAQKMADGLKPGGILLLENLRFYKEEEKGDEGFAKKLSVLGNFYVNDAFGTAHRAHASTSIIAQFFPKTKAFGYVMASEVLNLNKVLKEAKHPFTAILGGAKVSGKIEIINHLMDKVDNLIIGGGMMFTIIKALGGETGNSIVEEELLELSRNIVEGAKMMGVNLYLPVDAVIADAFSNDANIQVANAYDIPDPWMGLDIGPNSCQKFDHVIQKSATILWNGPMGVFEMDHFEEGTKFIAQSIVTATENGAFSLVGGGDSVAAIHKYNLDGKFSYISTGGGAMLEYIEGKILPRRKSDRSLKTIVLSRTDSIGDVILTLPVAGVLKKYLPGCRLIFLGKSYTRPVIEASVNIDQFLDWDEIRTLDTKDQITNLSTVHADAIIHVFPDRQICKLAKQAGIPVRIATSHRWFTALYCNDLVHFSRMNSDLHEAQLNLKMLEPLGISEEFPLIEIPNYYGLTKHTTGPLSSIEYRASSIQHPASSIQDPGSASFNLILHPKSRGSAREWGLENFSRLIDLLPRDKFRIFITGTDEDGLLMKDFLEKNKEKVTDLTGKLSLSGLMTFINSCDGLVAASTGPLHIAAALGKHVLGLYAPMKPIYPKRWAPLGKNAEYLVFDKEGCTDCKRSADCECIRGIKPEEVAKKLVNW